MSHDVVITGIGLVSTLGEGVETHWQRLSAGNWTPAVDSARFAPYSVHPLPEIDWNLQIAKRGDQRQMETWQRLGTYAAGLALDDAGIKGDEALCATMDMIVAAGGGERDQAVDETILDASESRSDRGLLLNEKLTTELRPTLFLAQLSNLLAGNISIVHKVTGSSRTFMGEEGAGVAAIETAAARIRSGQSTHALVGGAYNAEHPDMLLGYELGGFLHRGPWQPVWQREGAPGGGLVTGSGGAFLVLESREHAAARGRKPYAVLERVVSDRAHRDADALTSGVAELLRRAKGDAGPLVTISGASGAHLPTRAEKDAASRIGDLTLRGLSSAIGHIKEGQFPFAVALAALAVHHGVGPAPISADESAAPAGPLTAALATAIGFYRFEGAALVTAAR
ncbi:MAG: beta-ketoacyl-ACP synthase [Rhizobiaceae bacterium]